MFDYPDTSATTQDLYDIAYEWGWSQPELRELVRLCYKTPDFVDNARRFYQSEEFQEVIRVLSKLGKPPGQSTRVLDFGCGNGIASYALSRIGYSVIGVDSSLGEIAGLNAAQKIQNLDAVSFELQHSTGEKLEFPDQSFDIVWIREALHHIKALDGFLSEIKRVLKPDGILCCLRDVVIWNEDQRQHFFATHPFYPITQDEGCYYLEEYLSAFRRSGLRVEQVLDPHSSIINTYPAPVDPTISFDEYEATQRQEGYDLFSFFVRKPREITSGVNSETGDVVASSLHYLNSRQNDKALELLDQLKQQGQLDSAGLYAQAIALARLNCTSDAIATLQRLLAIAPAHSKAKALLMELQALMAQPDRPNLASWPDQRPSSQGDLEQRFPLVTFGSMVQLIGMQNMQIGEGSCIGDQVWLNVCNPDPSMQLRIGRCALIGRQSIISTGGYLEIGDYCLLAPRVYVSSADHIYADISRPYIEQGATVGRSLTIEENCWLGINSVVMGSLTVGRGAVVAANSMVRQDVLPFCVVAGSPSRIVKMYNPLTQQWEQTRSESEQQRLLEIRDRVGLPSREEYRELLRQNAQIRRIDPILAGHGISI